MKHVHGRLSWLLCLTAAVGMSALRGISAQQPAGSDWSRVQAVAAGTLVRVSYGGRPVVCSFVSADTSSLICTRTRTFFFVPYTRRLVFPRSEVASVKLSRQFASGLTAAGIGAGAGAGIGAGIESQYSGNDDPHLLTIVLALFGAGIGSTIGSATDFLAGPTLYRAP